MREGLRRYQLGLWFSLAVLRVHISAGAVGKLGANAKRHYAHPVRHPAKIAKLTAQQRQLAQAVLRQLDTFKPVIADLNVESSDAAYAARLAAMQVMCAKPLRSLPQGNLKARVQLALNAYKDAGTIWKESLSHRDSRNAFLAGQAGSLLKKYDIAQSPQSDNDDEITADDRSLMLHRIWAVAAAYTQQAEKLLAQDAAPAAPYDASHKARHNEEKLGY